MFDNYVSLHLLNRNGLYLEFFERFKSKLSLVNSFQSILKTTQYNLRCIPKSGELGWYVAT